MASARSRKRTITIRRIYQEPGEGEGYRVLVDRLWPRGVRREPGLFDEWAKDAAPTAELRRWYGHDPDKFTEFSRRYRAELAGGPGRDVVARLGDMAALGPVTLLTATKDVGHSGAAVLREVIAGSA